MSLRASRQFLILTSLYKRDVCNSPRASAIEVTFTPKSLEGKVERNWCRKIKLCVRTFYSLSIHFSLNYDRTTTNS
jgi:hypothetical protein